MNIKKILEDHELWLDTEGKKGARANLKRADLSYANLEGARLHHTNLSCANLRDANLEGASFWNTKGI